MSVTVQELNALFSLDSDGNHTEFHFDSGIGKYVGQVVSSRFKGLGVPERQKLVWDQIRKKFGPDSQEISLVFTFSPREFEESEQVA